MRKNWLIVAMLVLFSLVPARDVCAQAEPDRIIAGEHLAKLLDAMNAGRVKITQPELKDQIVRKKLSAILLPSTQPEKKRNIRRCFKDRTIFDVPDWEVPMEDYSQLIAYAKDGVFQRVAAIRDSVIRNDSKALDLAIADLNSEIESTGDKEGAKRFAGALLADFEPSQPQLASYVSDFREHVEKSTLAELRNMAGRNFFTPRTPYSFGSTEFSSLDLWKVNPSAVDVFTFNNKVFRKTWVGGTYIVAYQGVTPPPKDPSGLGLSANWVGAIMSPNAFKVVYATQLKF
jgi:hypothetical protein